MEVILLDRVRNLGNIGDRVSVKGGYGRNCLIPKGQAVPASPENIEMFDARRIDLERAAAEILAAAQKRAEMLNSVCVKIVRSAGEEGKLYGSVTTRDIVDALRLIGHEVDRKEINLSQGAFREVGTSVAEIHLHADVIASITVEIAAG